MKNELLKKIVSISLVGILALGATACGSLGNNTNTSGKKGSPKAKYTIRVGHTLQESTPAHKAWLHFKDEVEKESDGQIAVEVYPNSSLGDERSMFEQCQQGTLEVAYGTTSVLANFEKNYEVLDLPFLFNDESSAREAMKGALGKKLANYLNDDKVTCLTYMENGIRHITNSKKPINTPDDLKGMKIRTMENSIHMAAFTSWGANPTPMAFTELFTALQNHTVDGEENPIFLIDSSNFDEVQKYLSLTGHFYTSGIATINTKFYNNLPDNLQKVVKTAAENARDYEYKLCDEQNKTALKELKKTMEVNEVSNEDKKRFKDASESVYGQVKNDVPEDLYDMITDIRDNNQ